MTAQDRFDRALTLLAGVQNSTPLNADESGRIADLLAPAVTANVFALESTRDVAQVALDEQLDVVAAAILDAVAKNPSVDPATDGTVQTAKGQLPALQQAVTDAETNYAAEKGEARRARGRRS